MAGLIVHAPDVDRVRANTSPEVNERIALGTQLRLRSAAAAPAGVEDRIRALDAEWDVDRVIETEAALTGLIGLSLGLAIDRRFLAMPAMAGAMLVVHATHGFYPMLPLFRRLGVRTADEIDRERYALKVLRGDFAVVPAAGSPPAERAAAAWEAVCI
jgi:hypothetical protein